MMVLVELLCCKRMMSLEADVRVEFAVAKGDVNVERRKSLHREKGSAGVMNLLETNFALNLQFQKLESKAFSSPLC